MGYHEDHEDHEGHEGHEEHRGPNYMAKTNLYKIAKYAKKLLERIEEGEVVDLPPWADHKISVAATAMGDVKHYSDYWKDGPHDEDFDDGDEDDDGDEEDIEEVMVVEGRRMSGVAPIERMNQELERGYGDCSRGVFEPPQSEAMRRVYERGWHQANQDHSGR